VGKSVCFQYSAEKDSKNCVFRRVHGKSFSSQGIKASKDLIDLLSVSQPKSIFNAESHTLNCYGAKSTLLKRAIILPNSYEIFLSPWLADSSCSYPHKCIREDWKRWFPTAHHAELTPLTNGISNAIRPAAFDGIKCLLNNSIKFVIKNHVDANNYWHWTFEWLPRLFALKELVNQNGIGQISFLNLGSDLNVFQTEWLDAVFGQLVDIASYDSPILCQNLVWITPPFPAHHCPETISLIRSHMVATRNNHVLKRNLNIHPRIYILRGNARNGRRIANEARLLIELKKLGFVEMAMDGLTVYEQAQLFSNAECIVGAHGSAFVNMVFCKCSCKIIELFGPGYVSGHDYSLSYNCGLHWEYIEGESVDASPTFTSDFTINPELLAERLSSVLRGCHQNF